MVGFANVMLVTKTVREGTEVKDLEILPKGKKTRQNIEVGGCHDEPIGRGSAIPLSLFSSAIKPDPAVAG